MKVINTTVCDATFVLDGLLYHESDLRIEEHCTDTAGFTDHVFALCHLLGFHFAPRIRDLADKRLYVPGKASPWPILRALIGASLRTTLIEQQFNEVVRLTASIQQGTMRGGSGNSDSVISGSLASPTPPDGGEPKEQGDEENETESRSDL